MKETAAKDCLSILLKQPKWPKKRLFAFENRLSFFTHLFYWRQIFPVLMDFSFQSIINVILLEKYSSESLWVPNSKLFCDENVPLIMTKFQYLLIDLRSTPFFSKTDTFLNNCSPGFRWEILIFPWGYKIYNKKLFSNR